MAGRAAVQVSIYAKTCQLSVRQQEDILEDDLKTNHWFSCLSHTYVDIVYLYLVRRRCAAELETIAERARTVVFLAKADATRLGETLVQYGQSSIANFFSWGFPSPASSFSFFDSLWPDQLRAGLSQNKMQGKEKEGPNFPPAVY